MRNSAKITIAGQEITLHEITVADVLGSKEHMNDIMEMIRYILPRCTDATPEDLSLMTFSELEQLYEKFKEVNAAFFRIAGMIGLPDVLAKLADEIRGTLIMLSTTSYHQGTAPQSTDMDGIGSAAA